MKPPLERFPGESRDPPIRPPSAGRVGPGFRRGSVLDLLVVFTPASNLGRNEYRGDREFSALPESLLIGHRNGGSSLGLGKIDVLVEFGDGNLDPDLGQLEDVLYGQGLGGAVLVFAPPCEDGQPNAVVFEDDVASDSPDGPVFTELDDTVGSAGGRAQYLQDDDDALYDLSVSAEFGAGDERIRITDGVALSRDTSVWSEGSAVAAAQARA
jgi:hypothetical protein